MALRLSGLQMSMLCGFVGRIRRKPPSGMAELPDGAALIVPTNVDVVWFCRPDKAKAAIRHGGVARWRCAYHAYGVRV